MTITWLTLLAWICFILVLLSPWNALYMLSKPSCWLFDIIRCSKSTNEEKHPCGKYCRLFFYMSMKRNFLKSRLQNNLALQSSLLLLQNRIVTFFGTLDVLALSHFTITSVELYVTLQKHDVMVILAKRQQTHRKTSVSPNILSEKN